MSRTNWGKRLDWSQRLVEILRGLGVKIDKKIEQQIEQQREADPDASTADIVQRLSLAPPELIERAVQIARERGSVELLTERVAQAVGATQGAREASVELTRVAAAAAKK